MMSGLPGLLVGKTLANRYLLVRFLKRGGMGAVFEAKDLRRDTRVAVKVAELRGSEDLIRRARRRFRREAEMMANVGHQNVVEIYDAGTDSALELDYLVMKLLAGSDLAAYLAKYGPPPISVAVRLLLGIARGLAAIHDYGLIHRDIKPANIFLASVGRGLINPIILDFGIVVIADPSETITQLTAFGERPHTPLFASPEQISDPTGITFSSDIFSLGVTAFLLMTGHNPLVGVMRDGNEVPVELFAARRFRPDVPVPLELLIQRCVNHDPLARFRDAHAFLPALVRAISACSTDGSWRQSTSEQAVVVLKPSGQLAVAVRKVQVSVVDDSPQPTSSSQADLTAANDAELVSAIDRFLANRQLSSVARRVEALRKRPRIEGELITAFGIKLGHLAEQEKVDYHRAALENSELGWRRFLLRWPDGLLFDEASERYAFHISTRLATEL